jgi:hypothetical protein
VHDLFKPALEWGLARIDELTNDELDELEEDE